MPLIGQFTCTGDGFTGRIRTLVLDAEFLLVPVENSGGENAPDYRIRLGTDGVGPEIGAAWKGASEKVGDYISLRIDDPTLAQPIRAILFQSSDDKADWRLHWNRPSRRGERD